MRNLTPVIEVVTPHTCQLGEGPVWDAEQQVICWIDILRGEIHQYSLALKKRHTIQVHEFVGSISLCSDNRFLAAIKDGFAFVDRATGAIEIITSPEKHLPNNRFNDGKCDPSGRFWAGSMSHIDEDHAGSLYVLDHDFSVKKMMTGTTISNGLAWTSDKKNFYHIDTPTAIVSQYDYDDNACTISNKKIAIKIPETDGFPDGMTIDAEDMLWIAHWSGGQITRWNPRTGEKLSSIKMPVTRITCCTFGGKDLTDLFVTSARKDLTEDELKEQPLSGSLFVIRLKDFEGRAPYRFIS